MVMQIRRTAVPNSPPSGLAAGQLGVEMASTPARLWVGVPTTVDPSGQKLLVPGGTQSGTTAPTTPNVGDLWFDTTNNELKVWNGSAWVISLEDAPSDGTPYVRQDGAWESLSIETMPGVTDGSDPAPGFVGEMLTQTNNAAMVGGNTNGVFVPWSTLAVYNTIATLLIPPGDWDVWCALFTILYDGPGGNPVGPTTLNTTPNNCQACISPSTITDPTSDYFWWPRGWSTRYPDWNTSTIYNLGPVRISSATSTTMMLRMSQYYDSYNAYYFSARRVR